MSQANQNQIFSEASTKYQAGDFKAAAALYEKAAQASPSFAAYYNLGNANFKAGMKGQALLAYERARQISPGDADLLWNIQILKSTLIDRVEPSQNMAATLGFEKIQNHVTMGQASIGLSSVIVILLLVQLAKFIIPNLRRFWDWLGLATLFVLALAVFVFGVKYLEVKDEFIVVTSKEVVARFGPSERETKAFVLHEGALARVSDESRDWVYITLPNKNSGWISRKSCQVV